MPTLEWQIDQRINNLIKKCVEGILSPAQLSEFHHLSAERTRHMRPNFPPKRRRLC